MTHQHPRRGGSPGRSCRAAIRGNDRSLGSVRRLLGDRLRLYRALAERGPASAVELASAAGVNERYAIPRGIVVSWRAIGIRWGWVCSSIRVVARRGWLGIWRVRFRPWGGRSRWCVDRSVRLGRWGMPRRCLPVWTSWRRGMTTRWRGGRGARIRWMRRFRCTRRLRRGLGCPIAPSRGCLRRRVRRMAVAWADLFAQSEAMAQARLLHLHHLTPIHDAAALALPGMPVVTHLHGTELKMLDAIARGESAISGPYAEWWASRMRDAARRAVATITISPHDQGQAVRLLGIDPETVLFDPKRRGHRPLHPASAKPRTTAVTLAALARERAAGLG